jgi:AraC family transcriptional regulator
MKAQRAFDIDQTHGMLLQPGNHRMASSDRLGWTTLYASTQVEQPFAGHFNAVEDQLIVLHRDGPAQIDGVGGDVRFRQRVPPGAIHLIPGGADFDISLRDPLRTLHVYVRRSVLVEVAAQMTVGDPAQLVIEPGIVEEDGTLAALLEAVALALEADDDGTPLYVDYLSQAIAAHLVRSYSRARFRAPRVGPASESRSPAVAQAIAYMRENLDAPLRLADIAQVVGRSVNYLAREFREGTGLPPHQYLIGLRIERARELLATSRMPVAEIAYECGFSHQEHMTRQFRKHCGTTPAAYRRSTL